MARKFSELRERMDPERRARNAEKTAALVAAIDLAELRGARNLTQEELAERLNIAQSNVSRLEQRDDILVSTLRQVIEAMGGELELQAAFPEGRVRLTRYEKPRSTGG
jgi:transcriptional regulator with XRE-family HTH domain